MAAVAVPLAASVAATSRDTVDGDRLIRPAITANVLRARSPREISSRSAIDSTRDDDGNVGAGGRMPPAAFNSVATVACARPVSFEISFVL